MTNRENAREPDPMSGERHPNPRLNVDAHSLHRQAAELLDRLPVTPADPAPWRAVPGEEATARGPSLLLFRLADEWLALPASTIEEVAPMRAWHSVPGHRQRALLGLVNLRGALVPCLSLGELLGVQPAPPSQATQPTPSNTLRASTSRLLALRHGHHLSAFPVTEVHGTVTPAKTTMGAAPATTLGASDGFAVAVLHWRDHVVGVLDPLRVGAAFDRSLA
ncbi:chemotaxis protein CheW [Pandoraea fibrosis]|uniref:Chemotaxis protein CheW n=1 Tax=Pandoraea fibrosis TaxID=1891094 RepID=A0ABX6HKE3_9BURK|nr:chemotaxis protein CheW [Pandoraea fibrosis]QHE90489.1 chemotaxis protein CheW [Pandoraea fibrosis]QHF11321.1 chemotaxis protein CheW [Pandoraea fibrosis]